VEDSGFGGGTGGTGASDFFCRVVISNRFARTGINEWVDALWRILDINYEYGVWGCCNFDWGTVRFVMNSSRFNHIPLFESVGGEVLLCVW
jgi:hypothetical protein